MNAENLSQLLDSLHETSVYVIEEATHRLLYFNRRCVETGRGKAAIGVKCQDVWPENCLKCPLDDLSERDSTHFVCYDPILRETVDVTADRLLWDGDVPAVAVTTTPHRLSEEDERGLRKIERMYAHSLLTVFDECLIVNLSADTYVACRKEVIWSGLPEQGNFGASNRLYAEKVLHRDDLDAFTQNFTRGALTLAFNAGKKQITKRLRRLAKDGSYRMTEFTAVRINGADSDELWAILVFRDVQEEYEAQLQRNVEISQLATAVRTAYQMLIAVNLTQNTYHMMEYERYPVQKPGTAGRFDDLIAAELATVHPDYRSEFADKFLRDRLIDAYASGARIVSMEVPHLGQDGIYHWNYTQVVRVESNFTDDLIEITLSRNIDEDRRRQAEELEKERRAQQLLEEALKKAEKASRAKSDFLSRMSHDIRTPMNAVIGMTELAKRHIGDTDKMRDYLDKIASSGAHLLGLINEVLDVSKIESGTIDLEEKEFDLIATVDSAVEMVSVPIAEKAQNLTVRTEDAPAARVVGDARRLRQILVNLLENASKYTASGGHISLVVEELKKFEKDFGTYRFTVEDDGIGMKPSYLEHIFEPFSRAEETRAFGIGGTGLGMTIVKNLVTLMGGEISVESSYGVGSRFVVTVCLPRGGAPYQIERTATESRPLNALRVLLVEDNELNRQIACEMLALLGVATDTVCDGSEAVEAVRTHSARFYDAVLMDIQMPKLNGYEATKAIRRIPSEGIDDLPIIAMTADAYPEDEKKARLSGMNGHLAKPISIDKLRAVLSECAAWNARKTRDQI